MINPISVGEERGGMLINPLFFDFFYTGIGLKGNGEGGGQNQPPPSYGKGLLGICLKSHFSSNFIGIEN